MPRIPHDPPPPPTPDQTLRARASTTAIFNELADILRGAGVPIDAQTLTLARKTLDGQIAWVQNEDRLGRGPATERG